MARLDRLVIGGERNPGRDRALALGLGGLEASEQGVGIGDLEIPFRELLFILEEHVAIADPWHVADGVGEAQVIHIVDILDIRSEEHTSELQSLMRISYAVL